MVLIKDEGSQFDAPIETVWAYLNAEQHGETHRSTRNQEMKPISDTSFELSMEQNMNGQWVKVKNRITTLAPLGMTIEILEGPMAGSKMMNVYTPKGNTTGIDVYGDFSSSALPPAQLEPAVRGFLQQMFDEDSVAIKELASKK
ncbi:MAG: hypothetical protein WCA77_04740 [Thermoplasmata archaeon]